MKISGKTLCIIVSMLALSSCTGLLSQQQQQQSQQVIEDTPNPDTESTDAVISQQQPDAEDIDAPEDEDKQEDSAAIISQQQPDAEDIDAPEEENKQEDSAAIISQQQPDAEDIDAPEEEDKQNTSTGLTSQQQQSTEDMEPPVSMPGQNSAAHLNIKAPKTEASNKEEAADSASQDFSAQPGDTDLQQNLNKEEDAKLTDVDKPKKNVTKTSNKLQPTRPTPEQEAAAYRLLNNPETYAPKSATPSVPSHPTLRLRRYRGERHEPNSETGQTPLPNAVELRGLRSPNLRSGNLPMDINGKLMPMNQR